METQHTKAFGTHQNRCKREVHKCLHRETRKISNNLILHLKDTEKEEQMKLKLVEGNK